MKTLVLLHPFPLSGEAFADDAAALASDELRVLTPTLHEASVDAMADEIARQLDALGVERAVVGGVSMGGYASLAFARRHPQRLSGLILADTRAEPDTAEARAGREAGIARLQKGEVAGFLDALLPKLSVRDHATVRRLALQQTPAALITSLRAMRDRPDARSSLAAIAVPTLVLVGSEDGVTPHEAAEVLHRGIRGAALVVLEGAGHLSNFDAPEAFRAAIRTFVVALGSP